MFYSFVLGVLFYQGTSAYSWDGEGISLPVVDGWEIVQTDTLQMDSRFLGAYTNHSLRAMVTIVYAQRKKEVSLSDLFAAQKQQWDLIKQADPQSYWRLVDSRRKGVSEARSERSLENQSQTLVDIVGTKTPRAISHYLKRDEDVVEITLIAHPEFKAQNIRILDRIASGLQFLSADQTTLNA